MTPTPGGRYSIVYREGGEEKTAVAHYRGFGTAAAIARDDMVEPADGEAGELHWFKIDGRIGYVTIEPDDLISYEEAEGYT
ncbi:MAG TPA: hypothetical protein VMP13_03975 [Acidimicrobiia bacterium]|nr:hypothetical protein [Acidimicrobiia bacterium]